MFERAVLHVSFCIDFHVNICVCVSFVILYCWNWFMVLFTFVIVCSLNWLNPIMFLFCFYLWFFITFVCDFLLTSIVDVDFKITQVVAFLASRRPSWRVHFPEGVVGDAATGLKVTTMMRGVALQVSQILQQFLPNGMWISPKRRAIALLAFTCALCVVFSCRQSPAWSTTPRLSPSESSAAKVVLVFIACNHFL